MESEVDWKLSELLGSKGCNQRHKVELEDSHQWCTPGVNAGAIPFKDLINNVDDETEHTLGRFADNTKLGGEANTSDGCAAIQRQAG